MLLRICMLVLFVGAASVKSSASDIQQLRLALIADAVATPANTQGCSQTAENPSPAVAQLYQLAYHINDQRLTALEGTMLTAAAEGLLRDREAIKLRQLRNPIHISESELRAIISTSPKSALEASSENTKDNRRGVKLKPPRP